MINLTLDDIVASQRFSSVILPLFGETYVTLVVNLYIFFIFGWMIMFAEQVWVAAQQRIQAHYVNVVTSISALYKQGGGASIKASQQFAIEWEQILPLWQDALNIEAVEGIINCLKIVYETEEFLRFHIPPTACIDLLEPLLIYIPQTTFLCERMSLLLQLGDAYRVMGNPETAKNYYDNLLALAEREQNRKYIHLAYHRHAVIAYRTKNFNEAIEYCQAIITQQSLIADTTRAATFMCMGVSYIFLGQYDNAEDAIKRGQAIYEKNNDLVGVANSLNNYGMLLRKQGNLDAAHSLYIQSMALNRKLRNYVNTADALYNLGLLARERGLPDEASFYYREALVYYEQAESKRGQAITYNNIGIIKLKAHNYIDAEQYFQKSVDLRKLMHDEKNLILPLANLCLVFNEQQKYPNAFNTIQNAMPLLRKAGLIRSVLLFIAHSINTLYAYNIALDKVVQMLAFVTEHQHLDAEIAGFIDKTRQQVHASIPADAYTSYWSAGSIASVEEILDLISDLISSILASAEQ